LFKKAASLSLINVVEIADLSLLVKGQGWSAESFHKTLQTINALFEKNMPGFNRIYRLLRPTP
jgi:hypothetical protein